MPVEWDKKRRKHIRQEPMWGYIRRTADECFPSVKGLPKGVSMFSDNLQFKNFKFLIHNK